MVCLLIIMALVFFSGCTTDSVKTNTQATASPAASAATVTATPTEAVYTVTEPVLIVDDGIYSTKTTINASDSGSNTLVVTVKFDSTNSLGTTGKGMEIFSTIFAYNYADVPYSFNPRSKDDVIAAGIPYKTVKTTVYPNNIKNAVADLPTDSVQGSLSLSKPYNYGAIVSLDSLRN
ncbi:ABC-type Fe3+-hydroxamate transport system substrate-binding protein [Methanomicrobium sp. W14]|uniref:hypothetical protein n=1 Tax=Methanomicrobium sp. W14 TaxID=2817839 RepID=UPI001AE70537|nr:hypothetical protein [Methanomicrobium sp. W14]MBP2132949.1 ABC-type Fe3+-hydroxamate transport system substrate-binding protein [Methanomicrobium sp. W14]